MEGIILLPALVAGWVAYRFSIAQALLYVYFPALLLLPDYYRLPWANLPKASFAGAVIILIGTYYSFRVFRWRPTVFDWLLAFFFLCISANELINQGASALRYFVFDFAASTAFPCLLARQLIEPNRMRTAFAKQIVVLLAVVSALNLYEFRMGVNLFRTAGNQIFSSQPAVWVTQLRWGYARTSGPFGHAILAGVIMAVGFMLFGWVVSVGAWKEKWLGLPGGKQLLYGAASAAGVLMTMSRGPWLGVFLALGIAVVGHVRNVKRAIRISAVVVALTTIIGGAFIAKYASVGRDAALTAEQETAAYRKELLDHYIPVVMERPWGGWGMEFPQVPGAGSIDNHYLLIALVRGLTGLGIFLIITGVVLFRLMRKCSSPHLPRTERTWGFTLLGSLLCILISLTTVYMGEQLATLFWILIGWSEGWIALAVAESVETSPLAVRRRQGPLSFARVIA